ncbi:MAG: hypothetical protein NE334_14890 [Lentisphaeraceae bacterium]|nr:hypothetical protein [Lentisphaeraceae bacterium]
MAAAFKNSKKAHEFIGLCLGVLADNKLVKPEVEFLRDWLRRHPRVAGVYPVKGLFIRLCEMLEDHTIDEAEEKELFQHLYDLTGTGKKKKGTLEKLPEFSSTVEYTEPIPEVDFEGKEFFLFGQFIIGTPERLKELIHSKGGVVSDTLSEKTEYCILGAMSLIDSTISEELGRQINSLSHVGMNVMSEESWVSLIF